MIKILFWPVNNMYLISQNYNYSIKFEVRSVLYCLHLFPDEWNQELSREDRRKYSMSLETLRSDESKRIRK